MKDKDDNKSICQICGKEIKKYRDSHKFCSRQCRQIKYYRTRKRSLLGINRTCLQSRRARMGAKIPQ